MMQINETCELFRQIRDEIDEVEGRLKVLKQELHTLEVKILEHLSTNGIDSIKAAGVTFTAKERFRAVYDPELWPRIMDWATGAGYSHIIQRRLSDAKVLELVDSGVALPEGLSVQSYKDLAFRRS